jgi:hypothetical protein
MALRHGLLDRLGHQKLRSRGEVAWKRNSPSIATSATIHDAMTSPRLAPRQISSATAYSMTMMMMSTCAG